MAPSHSCILDAAGRRRMRKSNSMEIIMALSNDNDLGSGVRLQYSPPPRDKGTQRPASSGIVGESSSSGSISPFQVGNPGDDDVFTETSASVLKDNATLVLKQTEEVAEGTSSPCNDEIEEANGQAVIPRHPAQIDAQHIYSSTACIFVANLPQVYDDQKLEVEVTKLFSRFGTVFVKIRRDDGQMPFAFCQFTCDADAQKAEQYGKGSVILGRPCRVEMAKAHTSFIVYKISGVATTEQDAINLLGMLGEIARVAALEDTLRATLKLPAAMVVHFKMYDPKRDVQRAFHRHRVYRVIPYEPKAAETQPAHKRVYDDNHMMLMYDRDRRSAFFGNLPLTMTDDTLASLASSCGNVVSVDLKRKHVPQGDNKSIEICFAFVEFVRPDSIEDVITAFHDKEIDGYTLRVQRKQSRQFETPRRIGRQVSDAQFPRSATVHRRRPEGAFDPSRPSYGGSYASPTAGHPGAFASAGGGPYGALPSPSAYSGGTFPRAARHVPRQSIVSAGLTAPDSLPAASEKTSAPSVKPDTPTESKSSKEESKVQDVKVEDEASKKNEENTKANCTAPVTSPTPGDATATSPITERKPEDIKGKGKAVVASSASSEVLTSSEATPTSLPTTTSIPPAMGYPMMPHYPAAYGYSPMHSYPVTPQGTSMMYGTYAGSYYTPTPMYTDPYSMYPLMATYGPIPFAETPTRPSGFSQTDERKKAETKEPDATSPNGSKSGKKESKSEASGDKKPDGKRKE